jgi:glutamate-1-semialdehyde 2,1-aminomutase
MALVAPQGPVYQAGTLSANPVGMRAGLATLQKVQRENVYEVLESRAAQFQKVLEAGFEKHDLPLQMSRNGSVFWIHQKAGKTIRRLEDITKDHAAGFKGIFHECLKRGVYLAPSGYEVGFIGFAHTPEILAEAAEKIISSAKEARKLNV